MMSVPAFGNTGFWAGVLVLALEFPRFVVVGVELLLCGNTPRDDSDWDCGDAT